MVAFFTGREATFNATCKQIGLSMRNFPPHSNFRPARTAFVAMEASSSADGVMLIDVSEEKGEEFTEKVLVDVVVPPGLLGLRIVAGSKTGDYGHRIVEIMPHCPEKLRFSFSLEDSIINIDGQATGHLNDHQITDLLNSSKDRTRQLVVCKCG